MKVGEGRKISGSPCTNCGGMLDGATMVGDDEDTGPSTGDYTVCIYCGHLMVFDENLKLRDPDGAELIELAADPAILAIQKARGGMRG